MKIRLWAGSILWGGLLAMSLSLLTAWYFSVSLFSLYHDWTGWRSLTGFSPNVTTEALRKIIWAVVFCSCWRMLWKLDLLMAFRPLGSKKPRHAASRTTQGKKCDESSPKEKEFGPDAPFDAPPPSPRIGNPSDCEIPIEEGREGSESSPVTAEDVLMGEVLGVEASRLKDFSFIKNRYRSAIAQYHPDKVSALGLEIREIAERKAKEINHAYEHFRSKYKKSQHGSGKGR